MILDNGDDSDSEGGCDEGEGGGEGGCEEGDAVRYTHSILHNSDGTHTIDLHTTIDINIVEYLSGCIRKIRYVDDSEFDITIEPFHAMDRDVVIQGKGLHGGNLNVKVVFQNITLKKWKKMSEKKRAKVIHLLKKMYP